MKKALKKHWATVKIKLPIFNLQYLSHFCVDFYATNTCEILVKNRNLLMLISHGTEAPLYTKQEESARERALCQLTECF